MTALPQTVGFKAEAVDEGGVWCAWAVEEVDNDSLTAGMQSGMAAFVIHKRSGIKHCWIGKESEETFPFSEQCLHLKKTYFFC